MFLETRVYVENPCTHRTLIWFGFKPMTFLLWGNSANQTSTVYPSLSWHACEAVLWEKWEDALQSNCDTSQTASPQKRIVGISYYFDERHIHKGNINILGTYGNPTWLKQNCWCESPQSARPGCTGRGKKLEREANRERSETVSKK